MTLVVRLLAGLVVAAAPLAALAQPTEPGSTELSGVVFANASHVDQSDDNAEPSTRGARFDLKRAYLAVEHRFTEGLSANLTTEFQYGSETGATDFFVKKVYLQAELSEALELRLGASDTPWIAYANSLYGNRWIDKPLVDRVGAGQSADWGVHAAGDLPGGVVSYAVSMLDGGGHRDPSQAGDIDIEARISAKIDDVQFGLGGYSGKLGEGGSALRSARRLNMALAYAHKTFRVGVEVFTAKNWDNVTTVATDRSRGYAMFAAYDLSDKINAFARYDRLKPTRASDPARTEDYVNLGLAYSPVRDVDIAMVYKRDTSESGGSKDARDEVGVYAQLRF